MLPPLRCTLCSGPCCSQRLVPRPRPLTRLRMAPTPLCRSLDFGQIVTLLNSVYCLGQLLEFVAFIWLRMR